MILEPLFGLSLVLNASLNLQNHAAAGASPWTQMSVRQKDAALLPLVRQATDCIVHRVFPAIGATAPICGRTKSMISSSIRWPHACVRCAP